MPLVSDSLRTLAHALVAVAVVIAGLAYGRDIVLPLALATILAFILAPLVAWVCRVGIPRGAAAAVIVTAAVLGAGALSAAFSAQLLELTGDLSRHKDNIVRKVRLVAGSTGDGLLSKATSSIGTIEQELRKELGGGPSGPPEPTTRVVVSSKVASDPLSNLDKLGSTVAILAQTGLTILLTVFLLIQYHDLRDRIIRIAGTDNIGVTASALSDAGERLSHLFTMQAVLNIGFGAFVSVALAIIGVPNPVMWGVATALLRFVPFVGSILAAIPPTLLAAGVDPGWSMMLATLAVFAIGEPIVGHVIEPLVLGRSAGISPLALIVSASFWTLLWGPVGLILAAPLTTLIVVLGQYISGLEFLSVMLSDQPPLTPEEEVYHRLIAGDPVAALPHIENAGSTQPLVSAGDAVVLPALAMASRDHRAGRIEHTQVDELGGAVDELLTLLAPDVAIDVGKEPKDGAVLVVPARGVLDAMAAKYVQTALQSVTQRSVVAITKGAGLTALASAPSIMAEATPAYVVLVSVGASDGSYTKLISTRAALQYPSSRILMLTRTDGASRLADTPSLSPRDAGGTSTLRHIADAVASGAAPVDAPQVTKAA